MRARAAAALLVGAIAVWGAVAGAQTTPTSDALFDGDTLQDVWIHINSRDWQSLHTNYKENTYYPCDFQWRGVKVYNAGCRSRGSFSRSSVKPGIHIEFDHYIGGQRFLGLSSLVLDNFGQDPTMVKERLTMQLLERMGVTAPREAHARVFVGAGQTYAGVYAVVEDINEAFAASRFGNGGGYVYEYNWLGPWGFEDLGDNLDTYWQRFEPKTREHEAVVDHYRPVREMVRAINEAAPEELEEALAPYLDLRTVITQAAVENFVSNWDGLLGNWGVNNFYLYRAPGATRFSIIPWDEDNTAAMLEMPPWHNVEANVLMQKVWASPELRAFYLQQLLVVSHLSGWISEEIAREAALIHGAVAADPVKGMTMPEFEAAVDEFDRFLQQRPAIVRQHLESVAEIRP